MASSSTADLRAKYFSKDWSITIPSRADVRFVRTTPARFEEMIPIITNADNNKYQDSKDAVWDEEAVKKQLANLATRYEEGPSKQGSIEMFVELDGKVVGYGGFWVVGEGKKGSIGLVLNKEGRGKGLGKMTVIVLAQICFQVGLGAVAGTMKVNAPMRGVMKSLGVAEKEQITDLPGRGIVSELAYSIEQDKWMEIDMNTDFEGR